MPICIETSKLEIVYADVEINEIHPNKYKQRLFVQNLPQGSQPWALAFGNNSKAPKEPGKIYSRRKGTPSLVMVKL